MVEVHAGGDIGALRTRLALSLVQQQHQWCTLKLTMVVVHAGGDMSALRQAGTLLPPWCSTMPLADHPWCNCMHWVIEIGGAMPSRANEASN